MYICLLNNCILDNVITNAKSYGIKHDLFYSV